MSVEIIISQVYGAEKLFSEDGNLFGEDGNLFGEDTATLRMLR